MKPQLPEPIQRGSHSETTIEALFQQVREMATDPEFINPLGLPTVMGYPIPEFQRPIVWTQDQQIRFIESIWYGFDLGTYTYVEWNIDPYRFMLIDGQQRLTAIQNYITDVFEVFGGHYSELEKPDQIRFRRTKFPSYAYRGKTERELREMYDLLNFSGTPHTEDQRALKD
jgi:hypothetical protein